MSITITIQIMEYTENRKFVTINKLKLRNILNEFNKNWNN